MLRYDGSGRVHRGHSEADQFGCPLLSSRVVLLGCPIGVVGLRHSAVLVSSSLQGVLCLLRYDGSGRVHRGHPDVLVSSSLSPWRHEL